MMKMERKYVDLMIAPHSTMDKIARKLMAEEKDGITRMEWWRFLYYMRVVQMYGLTDYILPTYREIERDIWNSVKAPNVDLSQISTFGVLKPWQIEALEFLASRFERAGIAQRGAMLHLDMGLGKTLTILSFIEWIIKTHGLSNAVIVAPAYLLYNWQDEIMKWWSGSVLQDVNVIPTQGRKTKIVLSKTRPNIVLTSYTSLGAYTKQMPKFIDLLVLDESHKIKNKKTMQTQNSLWWNAKFSVLSTGTLFTNYPHEIWTQYYRVIKGSKWFDASYIKYYDWMYRYCYVRANPFGGVSVMGVNKRYLPELQARLYPMHLRMTKEEVLKLDMPIIVEHRVKTNVEVPQEDIDRILSYVKEDRKMPEHLTQWLRRMALEKLPYIKNLVLDFREQHEKVLIFTWHNEVTKALEEELKKYRPSVVYASMSKKKRWEKIQEFKNGESDILIGSIGVLGEGLNLPEVNHVVFAQLPMTASMFRQAIDRARRIKKDGSFNQPTVHVILGENDMTRVEYAIWSLVKRKAKVFDTVFDR